MSNTQNADIIIIGAGLAGATAASLLGRQGFRVILTDSRDPYPACFKAEKIEEDQADLFRKFGLMESLLPVTGHIRSVLNAQRGKVQFERPLEQYGIFYHDMVNIIRRGLRETPERPERVDFRLGKIEKIVTGSEVQRVTMGGGEELTSRLLVVACGTAPQLCAQLGISRNTVRNQHSFCFGFDIERPDGQAFPFDSISYYPHQITERIAYLTLFLIGDTMRANLFTYRTGNEEWVRRFMREPAEQLERSLPGIGKTTGPFRVRGRVECASINIYTTSDYRHPGLLLIGDAFQSVCPTTGTGLTRVLTDVDVLSECLPGWLSTPGMGLDKINQFYDTPRKIAADTSSLSQGEYIRQVSTATTFRWGLHRARIRVNALFGRYATA